MARNELTVGSEWCQCMIPDRCNEMAEHFYRVKKFNELSEDMQLSICDICLRYPLYKTNLGG